MDSDSFFGFDNSHPAEDEGDVEYDADFDALNDETFGSAAVDGDWEESHTQLSSLTEAEKSRRRNKNLISVAPIDSFNQRGLNQDHSTYEGNSYDKPRLFERNVTLGELGLSSSPGNSIWTPTQSLLTNNRKSISDLESSFNQFQHLSNALSNAKLHNGSNYVAPPPGLPKQISSIKTVEELESELKRQHSLPSFFDRLNKPKPAAMTVEDLERMNSKPSMPFSMNNPQGQHMSFNNRPNQHSPFPNYQHLGNGVSRPNHMMPHQQNMGPNHPGFRPPFGNMMKRTGMPFHPMLNPHGNRPGISGMINNMGPHMHNGNLPHRPMGHFNHRPQHNRMGDINGGFFPNGSQIRNPNFIKNNIDRRNFEQNMRFEHMRSSQYERDQNSGHSNEGGNRIRRDSDAEWEEWQRARQLDDYAGLMTPREKNWLRNIQGLQLQTDNPYQDDYYYVMHTLKYECKREEEVIELDGLQMLLPDKGKEYEPPKLENSLGKLQVASVNAPRKIIDLQVVHLDSSHPTTSLQRDMRKHRTILMHIEKMYDSIIELDDLQRKIRALPDCPTRDSYRSKCRQLVAKLWTELINPHESFVQILCVKKGKTLAARLMNWIGENEVDHLLATVIQNISLLSKKDATEKRLPLLWPIADRFFATRNASSITNFGIMMNSQLKIQKNSLIPALECKFGLSILLALLVRGEYLWNELQGDEAWMMFVTDAVTALSIKGDDEETLEPLLSITLAASAKYPCAHVARFTKIDPDTLRRASQVLKAIENYLLKNTPSSN